MCKTTGRSNDAGSFVSGCSRHGRDDAGHWRLRADGVDRRRSDDDHAHRSQSGVSHRTSHDHHRVSGGDSGPFGQPGIHPRRFDFLPGASVYFHVTGAVTGVLRRAGSDVPVVDCSDITLTEIT